MQAVQNIDVAGVSFQMQDQLLMVVIENEFASAKITTHGATVLSFCPKGQQELIWVSDCARYDGSRPVRGGIPVCWPWFGAHPTEASLPAHGFVRNQVWRLDSVVTLETGKTQVCLCYEPTEADRLMWPYRFSLSLTLVVGESLRMSLSTTNEDSQSFELTEALHTYFSVAEANAIQVEGLKGSLHQDKLNQAIPDEIQTTDVVVYPPMDSVYLNQQGTIRIRDALNERSILIDKENAQSVVVWNPGEIGAQKFVDMSDQAWPNMLCVEAGNVLDNAITLEAGEQHCFNMVLSVRPE